MSLTSADVRHLLRRAGYGALPAQVDDLKGRSRADAVDRVLATAGGADETNIPPVEGRSSSTDRRVLTEWWVGQMISSPAPIVERLTYFWHSHFACSSDRVYDQRTMRGQHWLFRRYGHGDFETLLQRIAIDPAMLIDLDNASNVAGDEQENFARELLELYTIGNGMFSEEDVVSVARAWTGYGLVPRSKPAQFEFHSDKHDKHDKLLFGERRDWNGPEVVTELVSGSREDQTAWFLATKLWREFGDPSWATADLITHLADVWVDSGHRAPAVIRALFLRDEFWAPERRFAVVKQPLSWLVELQRRTGQRIAVNHLDSYCDTLGQRLFLPPSVGGWGHNGVWLSPVSVLERARVARDLSRPVQESGWLGGLSTMSSADAANHLLTRFGVPDASSQTKQVVENWHAGAVGELRDYWLEREAFRLGALLPEVNLA